MQYLGYAAVSLAVLIVTLVVTLTGFSSLTASVASLKQTHEIMRTLGSIQRAVLEMESRLTAIRVGQSREDLDGYRAADKKAREGFSKINALFPDDAALTAQLRQAQEALTAWQEKVANPALNKKESVNGSPQARQEPSSSIETQSFESAVRVMTLLNDLENTIITSGNGTLRQISEGLKRSEIVACVGISIYAAFWLTVSFYFGRQVARPIFAATRLAEAIKQGDLSGSMKVKGLQEAMRLGTSLNAMAASLADYNKRILEGVEVLRDSVSQIASTASELFAGASGTASAITETTGILNEMEKTAKVVNETARSIVGHAEQSDEIATTGTKATGDTLDKMHLISEKMEIVGASVAGLSDNTRFVEDIIGVVKDLADQSNLLAVNASIEAARAGEHGKGFAVVAHEIKSLADQSREATENVSKILQEIRKSVTAVVMATEEGGKAVERGVKQSEAAGESIENLAGRIAEFSQSAGVISSSSGRQFARVERAASAMRGVELAMKESVEATTQLETEARRLGELAQSLKDMVRRYE